MYVTIQTLDKKPPLQHVEKAQFTNLGKHEKTTQILRRDGKNVGLVWGSNSRCSLSYEQWMRRAWNGLFCIRGHVCAAPSLLLLVSWEETLLLEREAAADRVAGRTFTMQSVSHRYTASWTLHTTAIRTQENKMKLVCISAHASRPFHRGQMINFHPDEPLYGAALQVAPA